MHRLQHFRGHRVRYVGDVRSQIIDAASREIQDRGEAGLRLDKVAAEVNISVSLLYRYVANRQELVLLGTERWAAEAAGLFEEQITSILESVTTFDQLAEASWGFVIDAAAQEQDDMRWGLAASVMLSQRHPTMVHQSKECRQRGFDALTRALERIIASSGTTPVIGPRTLSRFLMSLWYGNLIALLNEHVERDPTEVAALLSEIIVALIQGDEVEPPAGDPEIEVIPGGFVLPPPTNRRDAILQAATEEIEEVGMSDFLLKSVAHRAGVTPSHVHYYFSSMSELLAGATVYRTNAAVEQWRMASAIDFELPVDREALARLFDTAARRAVSSDLRSFRHETVESLLIARNHPAALAAAVSTSSKIRTYWMELLDTADEHGLLRREDFTCTTIASLMQTLVYGLYFFDNEAITPADVDEWRTLDAVVAKVIMVR